ncbi:MAG TPA: DUF2914 domain-containing protein [Chitinivibrionales bacterium]|nr:DUF2914 domain-containing protein [Chitinivibrionales bacterium]
MKRIALLAILGLVFMSFTVFAQTDSTASTDSASSAPKVCKLDSIAFGTGVESRALVGVTNVFEPTSRKVFCWTKISIDRAPVTVKHVWYNGSEKVFELPLRLKYASGRLWSYKTVTPGDWKVDVVNEQGEVIGSGTFTAK